MDKKQLQSKIHRLLNQQLQCVLATINGACPMQHMMAYSFSPDLSRIYLATYKNTRKFSNMVSNPIVSVFWDNRSGSVQDHLDGYSLTANGHATLLADNDQSRAREAILSRNATLKDLLNHPDCRLFEVVVDEYQWTTGYNQVFRFKPTRTS